MTGLEKLKAFCTKDGRDFPSRLAVENEMNRILAEEGAAAEFILFPFAFKAQDDFRSAVQRLWDSGYQAIVHVRKGDRHAG